jgi:hypothetical protein
MDLRQSAASRSMPSLSRNLARRDGVTIFNCECYCVRGRRRWKSLATSLTAAENQTQSSGVSRSAFASNSAIKSRMYRAERADTFMNSRPTPRTLWFERTPAATLKC